MQTHRTKLEQNNCHQPQAEQEPVSFPLSYYHQHHHHHSNPFTSLMTTPPTQTNQPTMHCPTLLLTTLLAPFLLPPPPPCQTSLPPSYLAKSSKTSSMLTPAAKDLPTLPSPSPSPLPPPSNPNTNNGIVGPGAHNMGALRLTHRIRGRRSRRGKEWGRNGGECGEGGASTDGGRGKGAVLRFDSCSSHSKRIKKNWLSRDAPLTVNFSRNTSRDINQA